MKKGDIVTISDSSYSFTVVNGYLEHHPGGGQKEHHVVIAVNCNLPADDGYMCEKSQRNDTIVRGQISGRIAFIQQRFLRLVEPTHEVMIDIKPTRCAVLGIGQVVEISDRLYKEIKRASQS